MYCRNCGKEINDNEIKCPYCNISIVTIPQEKQKVNTCWGVLGFCCPIIGVILYILWKDVSPANAKIAAKGALVFVMFFLIARLLDYIL